MLGSRLSLTLNGGLKYGTLSSQLVVGRCWTIVAWVVSERVIIGQSGSSGAPRRVIFAARPMLTRMAISSMSVRRDLLISLPFCKQLITPVNEGASLGPDNL